MIDELPEAKIFNVFDYKDNVQEWLFEHFVNFHIILEKLEDRLDEDALL
jgi:hypothetical protein